MIQFRYFKIFLNTIVLTLAQWDLWDSAPLSAEYSAEYIFLNIKNQLWRISLWYTRQIKVACLLSLCLLCKPQRQPKTDSVSCQGNELGQMVYHFWYVAAIHITFLELVLFLFSYRLITSVEIYEFSCWEEK